MRIQKWKEYILSEEIRNVWENMKPLVKTANTATSFRWRSFFCTNARAAADPLRHSRDSFGKGNDDFSLFPARLWAMERVSKHKSHLLAALKAWRIPACLDMSTHSLPENVGPLVYLDRLQLHQFYWTLGYPRFLCTKFQLQLYDKTWEQNMKTSQMIATLDVYPHVVNLNKDNDIINVAFVNPQKWGKRSPISFVGEEQCIGLKKGGILKKDLIFLAFQSVDDICDITVDVSELDIGEEIAIKDLNLNFQLTENLALSAVICKVLPAE